MSRKLSPIVLVIFSSMMTSCSINPVPIAYGTDQCHACKMIISDKRFGAELVTQKGRIYKFDAVECLVPEVKLNGEEEYAFIMVTDFHRPGKLMNAQSSQYLISPNRPSPMGGFLSAYEDEKNAGKALEVNGGDIFSWEGLKVHDIFGYLNN